MREPRRVPCVGAVVRDERHRLLLVLRRRPPAEGTWSLPGGRVEPGESTAEACRREVAEETGLVVEVGPLVGTVERAGPDGATYMIRDHACAVLSGRLRAGDDAAGAGWFTAEEVRRADTSPGLVETLTSWEVLPASS